MSEKKQIPEKIIQTEKNIKTEVSSDKIKEERFKRIASARQNRVIDKLGIFGKISDNPQNYSFDKEQIYKLFEPIESFTAKLKQKFLDCINVEEQKEEYKINL